MMKDDIAEKFAEEINDSFDGNDDVKAWADVHGKREAELVVEINYRDEGTYRLHVQTKHEAMAIFQLIFASKEQGLEDTLGT